MKLKVIWVMIFKNKCIPTLTIPFLLVWIRKWQIIPVSLPGESHGWRSLVGCSPWDRKDVGTTEWLTGHFNSCVLFHQANILKCSTYPSSLVVQLFLVHFFLSLVLIIIQNAGKTHIHKYS